MQNQSVINQLFDETDEHDYGGMDPNLYGFIVNYKKTGNYPPFIESQQKISRNALFHWRIRCSRFILGNHDTLFYVDRQNSNKTRVVVKKGEAKVAIKVIHERSGHAGQKQTQNLIARKLYWHGIRKDVARFVNECNFCKTRRSMRKTGEFDQDIALPIPKEEEVQILERLLLIVSENTRSDPITYEYINGMQAFEEDMEDIFANDESFSKKLSSAALSPFKGGTDNNQLTSGAQSVLLHSPDSRTRNRNHGNDSIESEVEQKKRKCGVHVSDSAETGYEQEHLSYNEDYHIQDDDFMHHSVHQSENVDMSNSVGSIFVQPVDREVLKLQKHVLTLQQEVLLLKKEYLTEKLSRLRSKDVLNVVD